MNLNPGGIIAWVVIGIVAGWLAGLVMRGGGYGFIADLIVGLIGALIGGFVFSFFVHGDAGFWGSMVIAFLGSCILVAVMRAILPGRTAV